MDATAEDIGKVDELVRERWDAIALYHLTDTQVKAILSHNSIRSEEGWLPAHHTFPEHAHGEPQLLLVKRGRLTHTSNNMSYMQSENDLLVVPANLKHTAKVGDEELEFWIMTRAVSG